MTAKTNTVKLNADGRIWICTTKGKYVGKGRVELLEKIQEHGSITHAAALMKMSYRQAWELIAEMNKLGKEPLVVSKRGGKGGGHATVTTKGKQVIAIFKSFNGRFQRFLNKETGKFIF